MMDMTNIWKNLERQLFVEKYFDYATEHLNEFLVAEKGDDFEAACRAMDYCLLCCTTAVQNLMNALPKNKLKTPKIEDGVRNPEFETIVWSWEARNTIAHRYIGFIEQEAEFDIGGESMYINNGADVLCVNGFFLKPVCHVDQKTRKSTQVKCPEDLSAADVLNHTVSFWRSVYEHILISDSNDSGLQYDSLWKSYKDKKHLN